MGKQVGKKTLLSSRITLPLKHTRHFIFLVLIKNPFGGEDMLHLPLFLDTWGFVLHPLPCVRNSNTQHSHRRLFLLRKGMSLSLIPFSPVLWLFPTCLPYLSLVQFSGTCLPALLQAYVSHSPQLPGLTPHCHWKTELGVCFHDFGRCNTCTR